MHFHFGLEGIVPLAMYCGGIAAFLASFRRPSIGLYVLAVTLPLQTIRARLFDFPLGNKFIDIILLGVVIGVLSCGRKSRFRIPLAGFLILLAIFYYLSLWQGALYLGGPLPWSFGDTRFSNWKNYVEMFLYCILTAKAIENKRQAQLLLLLMAFSVLLVNKGFYDTMGGRDLSHFSYDVRDSGTLGYAGENGLAAFEVMMASFFLGFAAYVKRLPLRIAIWGLVGTSVYCILFSFSREAYVALFAGLLVLGVLKERKLLIAVVIVLIAWGTLLPQSVQERVAMTTEDTGVGQQLDSSAGARLEIWKDAMDVFGSSPIIGIGFNTYEFLGRGIYSDTHNYYVKVLLETGVVGLLLFLWLLGRMWVLAYGLFRRAQDPFWASIGLGFVGLLGAGIVVNFFGDRWTYQQVDGFLWILLGLVICGLRETWEQGRVEESQPETVPEAFETIGALA